MDITGNSVSAPKTGAMIRPGKNTFIPLDSGAQLPMRPLPGNGSAISLPNKPGQIPFSREQKLLPLSAADGTYNAAAEKAKLRKAAEGFEAIFLRQLLKTMRSTVPEGNMYGGGSTGEMYADMVESSLAETMSKQGRLGIANTLYNRMVKRIDQREISQQGLSNPVSSQDRGR